MSERGSHSSQINWTGEEGKGREGRGSTLGGWPGWLLIEVTFRDRPGGRAHTQTINIFGSNSNTLIISNTDRHMTDRERV